MIAGRKRPATLGDTHITAAPLGQDSHLWQLEIHTSAQDAMFFNDWDDVFCGDDDDDDDEGDEGVEAW